MIRPLRTGDDILVEHRDLPGKLHEAIVVQDLFMLTSTWHLGDALWLPQNVLFVDSDEWTLKYIKVISQQDGISRCWEKV